MAAKLKLNTTRATTWVVDASQCKSCTLLLPTNRRDAKRTRVPLHHSKPASLINLLVWGVWGWGWMANDTVGVRTQISYHCPVRTLSAPSPSSRRRLARRRLAHTSPATRATPRRPRHSQPKPDVEMSHGATRQITGRSPKSRPKSHPPRPPPRVVAAAGVVWWGGGSGSGSGVRSSGKAIPCVIAPLRLRAISPFVSTPGVEAAAGSNRNRAKRCRCACATSSRAPATL